MKREEAIEILDSKTRDEALAEYDCRMRVLAKKEAARLAVSALRTQRPVKLDRSKWKGCEMCHTDLTPEDRDEGRAHNFHIDGDSLYYFDSKFGWEGSKINFCPVCSRPLTEEAWAELERRTNGGTVD